MDDIETKVVEVLTPTAIIGDPRIPESAIDFAEIVSNIFLNYCNMWN